MKKYIILFIIMIFYSNSSFSKQFSKEDFKNINNVYGMWVVSDINYSIKNNCNNKNFCKNKLNLLRKEIGKKILISKDYFEYDYNNTKDTHSNFVIKNINDYNNKKDIFKYYRIKNPKYYYIEYNEGDNHMTHNVSYTIEMIKRDAVLLVVNYFDGINKDIKNDDDFKQAIVIQYILDDDGKREIGISNYNGMNILNWILILKKIE